MSTKMRSGDLCYFGPERYQVTHYRCNDYRDGTVTNVVTGDIVKEGHWSNPMGFNRPTPKEQQA